MRKTKKYIRRYTEPTAETMLQGIKNALAFSKNPVVIGKPVDWFFRNSEVIKK